MVLYILEALIPVDLFSYYRPVLWKRHYKVLFKTYQTFPDVRLHVLLISHLLRGLPFSVLNK